MEAAIEMAPATRPPKYTVEMEKLAVQAGVWPLKESVNGVVKHTYVPRSLTPVSEYLKTQERFEHLFTPPGKPKAVDSIQQSVNAYWTEAGAREGFDVRLPEAAP